MLIIGKRSRRNSQKMKAKDRGKYSILRQVSVCSTCKMVRMIVWVLWIFLPLIFRSKWFVFFFNNGGLSITDTIMHMPFFLFFLLLPSSFFLLLSSNFFLHLLPSCVFFFLFIPSSFFVFFFLFFFLILSSSFFFIFFLSSIIPLSSFFSFLLSSFFFLLSSFFFLLPSISFSPFFFCESFDRVGRIITSSASLLLLAIHPTRHTFHNFSKYRNVERGLTFLTDNTTV